MGSAKFSGVNFRSYPNDHAPPHIHGFYAGIEGIVSLGNNSVVVAARKKAIKPGNASVADVRHILTVAAEHYAELHALWKEHRD